MESKDATRRNERSICTPPSSSFAAFFHGSGGQRPVLLIYIMRLRDFKGRTREGDKKTT
jgi:hypothetical protein